MVVETALRKAGRLHQRRQSYRVYTVLAKQSLGGRDDRFTVFRRLFSRNAHLQLLTSVYAIAPIDIIEKDNCDHH